MLENDLELPSVSHTFIEHFTGPFATISLNSDKSMMNQTAENTLPETNSLHRKRCKESNLPTIDFQGVCVISPRINRTWITQFFSLLGRCTPAMVFTLKVGWHRVAHLVAGFGRKYWGASWGITPLMCGIVYMFYGCPVFLAVLERCFNVG